MQIGRVFILLQLALKTTSTSFLHRFPVCFPWALEITDGFFENPTTDVHHKNASWRFCICREICWVYLWSPENQHEFYVMNWINLKLSNLWFHLELTSNIFIKWVKGSRTHFLHCLRTLSTGPKRSLNGSIQEACWKSARIPWESNARACTHDTRNHYSADAQKLSRSCKKSHTGGLKQSAFTKSSEICLESSQGISLILLFSFLEASGIRLGSLVVFWKAFRTLMEFCIWRFWNGCIQSSPVEQGASWPASSCLIICWNLFFWYFFWWQVSVNFINAFTNCFLWCSPPPP